MPSRTTMIHSTGTRMSNARPTDSRTIRSARSMIPPLAVKPRLSALARSYEMAAGDQERCAHREGEPDDCEDVGVDPGALEALANRLEPTLDVGAPASVEHVRSFRARVRDHFTVPPAQRTPATPVLDSARG